MAYWAIPPPFPSDADGGGSTTTGFGPAQQQQQQQQQQQKAAFFAPQQQEERREKKTVRHVSATKSSSRSEKPVLPVWLPATKHVHAITNCAPNGMRLFSPPPSLLLGRQSKKQRDMALRGNLKVLKDELANFEHTYLLSGGPSPSLPSLTAISARHGRLMSDLREMEQVTTKRCESRWVPGLGRRKQKQQRRRWNGDDKLPSLDGFKPVLPPMEETPGPAFTGAGGLVVLGAA